MRIQMILLATTLLTACAGGGPTTAGGNAVATGAGTTSTVPASAHTFANPTEVKTYSAIGGAQHFDYVTDTRNTRGQYGQLYAGDASTARDSGITITYNPRDAIFDVVIAASKASVTQTLRFQDPLHRTNFGGLKEPQQGTPDYTAKGFLYLEAGSTKGTQDTDGYSSNLHTFFYEKPGTTTKYVTLAGYLHNALDVVKVTDPNTNATYLSYNYVKERGAFTFGERSSISLVPKTGSATFTGDMIASLIYNPLPDIQADAPSYYQWINGTATTAINFAANTFTIALAGTVGAPDFDRNTNLSLTLNSGASFSAAGSGTIDLVNKGGFLGSINSTSFTQPGSSTVIPLTIAGSSVDGTFFGPTAQEVGGGFRIVGGTPDQRIDIHGAFVGK